MQIINTETDDVYVVKQSSSQQYQIIWKTGVQDSLEWLFVRLIIENTK